MMAVALGSVGFVASAAADEPSPAPAVRWSVTPADAQGPDGRVAVEHDLAPGATVEEHLAVRNVSDRAVTFTLAAADGFYTRTGRFDTLATGQSSTGAGTWITLPDSVAAEPGETVVIPYTIAVPPTSEPGDHAAGITASILSVQTTGDGARLGVETRVGFRVLLRVTGVIAPAVALTEAEAAHHLSWNPLRPGSAEVSFIVVNEGNTRVRVTGTVTVTGKETPFPAPGESAQELLPGDVRPITVAVDEVWPLFRISATVTLTATAVTTDGTTTSLEPVTAQATAWAIPWPQILVVGVVVLIAAIVAGALIASRRRINALLDQAWDDGRRSAEARRAAAGTEDDVDAGDDVTTV
jgi:archaellum component FlaG (FlaF/FlaG flagellin family)